ncbi:MAG: sigma-70 family RNA polymerase sigma factor [Planctomycetota bacterium]|nr:sigma-70 family RNA polymerase sigma factor [Planctomycetota bacterium]
MATPLATSTESGESAIEVPREGVALDPRVVVQAIAGDERAWSEIVHRYKRLVYSIPRRMGLDAEGCDDVFQTVFGLLVRELPKVRDPQAVPKWLITTTQRECWRVLRRAARAQAEGDASNRPEPDGADIEQWERAAHLDAALRALGGRCEALLRLLYRPGTGVSYEQVAEELGMPLGSIGPTRVRCLAKLAGLMKKDA